MDLYDNKQNIQKVFSRIFCQYNNKTVNNLKLHSHSHISTVHNFENVPRCTPCGCCSTKSCAIRTTGQLLTFYSEFAMFFFLPHSQWKRGERKSERQRRLQLQIELHLQLYMWLQPIQLQLLYSFIYRCILTNIQICCVFLTQLLQINTQILETLRVGVRNFGDNTFCVLFKNGKTICKTFQITRKFLKQISDNENMCYFVEICFKFQHNQFIKTDDIQVTFS